MNYMVNYTESDVNVGDRIVYKHDPSKWWTITLWENDNNEITGAGGTSAGSQYGILNCLNAGTHILEKAKSPSFNRLYEKLK